MLDWNDLKHFLAVGREGNLARAGASLEIAATTVGRRVSALEEQIGTRLFDRTPDGWILTASGRDLMPRAERIESEAIAAERVLCAAVDEPRGEVRLTATEMLATRFIAPHLPRFRERYPEIELDLICTNKVMSLARREADIALRLSRPREDGLVIRRLGQIDVGLYASQDYLEAHGRPDDPERSLAGKHLVLFRKNRHFSRENEWLEARGDGASVVLRSNSVSSVYAAITSGLGVGLLPRIVAERNPTLERLQTETAPEPREIWQSVHRDNRDSARIRPVLDYLVSILTPY
ncbi:MAG: LysR family transcriptional regulator [Myxococcota bacterium]